MAVDHEKRGPTAGVTPHLTIPSRGGQAALEFYARAFGPRCWTRSLPRTASA